MKSKYINHSSEKTRLLIRNTFSKLIMEKKELNKITVTELVKRADINRGTFYNHYDSIYDVANDLEEEILDVLICSTKEFENIENIFNFFDDVIIYLKNNEDMYKMILSSKEPLLFLEKLNILLQNNLNAYLLKKGKTNQKANVSFYVDGVINQALKYFKGKLDYSLDDLSNYMKIWFKLLFN